MPKRTEKNKKISVILLDFHKHLGEKFDVARVAPSYAVNVLFPQQIAIYASKDNLHKYQTKMNHAKEILEKKAQSINDLFGKMTNDGGLTLSVKINPKGGLYAKIGAQDIVSHIKSLYSFELDAAGFQMKKKIDSLGEYTITYSYRDLKKTVAVAIKKEGATETVAEEQTEKETTEKTMAA